MGSRLSQAVAQGHASKPPASAAVSELLATAIHLHKQRDLPAAESYYKAVLKREPAHFQALLNLGSSMSERRDYGGAIAVLKQATKANVASIDAYTLLSRSYREHGQHRQALRCLERALEIKPEFAEAHNECGILLIALEDPLRALERYRLALAIRPDYVEALYNCGNALVKLNQHEEALQYYERALVLRPTLVDALHNRGNVLRTLQRYREAYADYELATRLNPKHLAAQLGCAKMLELLHRPDAALARYRQAVEVSADSAEAWYGVGAMLQRLSRYGEARDCYRRTLELQSDFPGAASMLAFIDLCCCDWTDLAAHRQRVLHGARERGALTLPWLLCSVVDSPEDQLLCAQRWAKTYFPPTVTPLWNGERYRHDRIRIAYLSADFHTHATSLLMAGVFERHDRDAFEVVAVSFGPAIEDAMRKRLTAAFDRFIDVSTHADIAVARMLREWEIDIAVDLKGYTTDSRSGILAHRPCPIQVSYLGYPGTMGSKNIDYLVADHVVIPLEDAHHYAEQVIHLPGCYQANDDTRRVASDSMTRAEAGLPEGGFVFCCFNNNFKITPETFAVWMRLLNAVDGSVLWLLEDNATAAKNLRLEAERRGIAAERLVFAARLTPERHLDRHRLADLFLDTLPCNAHTTASDALWAGLPIVTCAGKTFAGRVCASLLHTAGLSELITSSLSEYEELALRLARTPKALAKIRKRLVEDRQSSRVFQTERFTRELEDAYRTMLERGQSEPRRSY